MAEITGRAYRHVTLEFAERVDPDEFRRLPGVIDLEPRRPPDRVQGDRRPRPVIKAAARHTVTDIELVRPTLEEVFLTYYGSAVMTVTATARRRREPRTGRARRAARCAPSSAAACATTAARCSAWGGPLGAMSALMAAMWPSIEGSMDELMDSYPEKLKDAFNIRATHERRGLRRRRDAELHRAAGGRVPRRARRRARCCPAAEERGYLDIVLTAPRRAPHARRRRAASSPRLVVAAVLARHDRC